MVSRREPPPRKPIPCDVAAMAQVTNIDRRTCRRIVPMKVLGLGVSRTGTASLRQALIDLGYSECYHFSALMNGNPRDAEMWNEAFEAKFMNQGKSFQREDWDQLLGHCMAVTDTPCAVFYRELLEAYPEAKVVLTIRDSPRQWWTSQMRTIIPFFAYFDPPQKTWFSWLWQKFLPSPTALDKLNTNLPQYYTMYQTLWSDYLNGREDAIQWYEEYVAEVKRLVPKENLLVMKVKEGWEPLTEFLGVDTPPWAFPKVNTIAEWDREATKMYQAINMGVWMNAARTLTPVVVGLGAVGAWAMMRFR